MKTVQFEQYQSLIHIDTVLNGYVPKYPFNLNQQAKFTEHQIKLYQNNYCHSEIEPVPEQPSITGSGNRIDVAFV